MLRSSRMVKGDKIRSLAHVCIKGRQPVNRAHTDESWDLRTIQHKDKLVLAKDRLGAQRWESSISVLFWKANITYSGKHKIPNTGTKKLKCPALEMSVFWISEWLKLSHLKSHLPAPPRTHFAAVTRFPLSVFHLGALESAGWTCTAALFLLLQIRIYIFNPMRNKPLQRWQVSSLSGLAGWHWENPFFVCVFFFPVLPILFCSSFSLLTPVCLLGGTHLAKCRWLMLTGTIWEVAEPSFQEDSSAMH